MQKYATTAGVLTLISGILSLLCGIIFMILIALVSLVHYEIEPLDTTTAGAAVIVSIAGFILLVAGVLSTVGGVSCIKKTSWTLALIGSIISIFIFLPLGIPAVIFTAISKPEFDAAAHTPIPI